MYFCLRIGKEQLQSSKVRQVRGVNNSNDMFFIRFGYRTMEINQYCQYTLNRYSSLYNNRKKVLKSRKNGKRVQNWMIETGTISFLLRGLFVSQTLVSSKLRIVESHVTIQSSLPLSRSINFEMVGNGAKEKHKQQLITHRRLTQKYLAMF